MKYLLPCECGAKSSIGPSQAGQEIECGECGRRLTAPTMRDMRRLEPVEAVEAKPESARLAWSGAQGQLFVAGLILLVLGLGLGGWSLAERLAIDTTVPQNEEAFDQLPPDVAWDIWMNMLHGGPDPYGDNPPEYAEARRRASQLNIWLIVCGVAAAAGVGLIAGSLLLRPRRSAGTR